jgi:glycine/D-amino acid oxidase-like deaminating enzyme
MDFGRGLCYASPSMRYDAIVVGAGPAGSYAAYLLAQRGAAVALLDRSAFPRDKPCGGALSHAHQRFLFDRIARSPPASRLFLGVVSGEVGYRECLLQALATLPRWLAVPRLGTARLAV